MARICVIGAGPSGMSVLHWLEEKKRTGQVQQKPGSLDLVRVSFETSFNLKQPKLELKLVSALFETKRLFRFDTKTESFGVSIEPNPIEEQLKQCDREHILVFFRKFRVVRFIFVCFKSVLFVSVVSI